MAEPAERMRSLRDRRRRSGLREIRLLAPDTRSAIVRARLARQVAALNPGVEEAALDWIESVSALEETGGGAGDEAG